MFAVELQSKSILFDFQYISLDEMSAMPSNFNLAVVLGPTASGKTAFAANLAYHINGEIISADSRQVYRKMNLGTGKDYSDYRVLNAQVPFHLIDIVDPGYKYSVFEYQRDFFKAYLDIQSRGKFPVMCGGSGMYVDAVTRRYRLVDVPRNNILREELTSKSLDELAVILSQLKLLHNETDLDTPEHALRAIEIAVYYRDNPSQENDLPQLNPFFIGIRYNRTRERERITERLEKRLELGMVDEVRKLLKSGLPAEKLIYYGLEYRYITEYLLGKTDYNRMVLLLNTAIHQFAKRQQTWFRKMEREGAVIHWLDGNLPMEEKLNITLKLMKRA
jgi:tRNA dimethylallyltransferase